MQGSNLTGQHERTGRSESMLSAPESRLNGGFPGMMTSKSVGGDTCCMLWQLLTSS